MKNKKSKLILLFALLMLSVTVVAAENISDYPITPDTQSDDAIITTSHDVDVQDNKIANNKIQTDNKNSKNMEGPLQTYTTTASSYDDLVNKVNSAKTSDYDEYTINLKKGSYNTTQTMTWAQTSRAYKLTINANGSTFNGKNTYQFMSVDEGYTFILKNAILTNFTSDEGGAVIFGDDYSSITVTNSTFIKNTAQKNGGAIYVHGQLNISDSTFTNNTATYYGGAIHGYYADIKITNSTFAGNTLVDYGGGGSAVGDYGGDITINNCTFKNNGYSDANGGAILNEEGYIKVTKSNFMNNVGFNGGAISVYYGDADVISSSFTNNSAEADGGAICNYYGDLNVTGSTFVKNTATYGGAIENVGVVLSESDPLVYQGNTKINNNTFKNNTADYGGAISSYVTLDEDYAEDETNNNGLVITNNILTGNHADIDGGAVLVEIGNKTTISNNVFDNNSAERNGGAIGYYGDDDYDSSKITITKNTFTNNNATTAGAIYNQANNVNITNNTLINNPSTDNNMIVDEGENTIIADNQYTKIYTQLTLKASATTPELGKNVTFTATLTDSNNNKLSNQDITFTIDGKTYTVKTNANGQATRTYTANAIKTLTISAKFNGTAAYNASANSTKITVKGKYNTKLALSVSNTTPVVNTTIIITAILTDENNTKMANQNVQLITDSKNYTVKTNANGTVTQSHKVTNIGTLTITAKYNGNTSYNTSSSSVKIAVRSKSGANSKVATKITLKVSNSTPIITNNVTINATLTDVNNYKLSNENITLTIDGKSYTLKTNANGLVTQTYAPTKAATINITAKYNGNTVYNTSNATLKITSKPKINTKLTLNISNKSPYAYTAITLTATLTDASNNKLNNQNIIFNINGTKSTVKTNTNGIATKSYTPSATGNQTITIQYSGNNIYNASTNSTKITVKETPKPIQGYIYVSSNAKGDGKTINTPTNLTRALSIVKDNEVLYLVTKNSSDTYSGEYSLDNQTVKSGTNKFTIMGQENKTITFKDKITIENKNITFKNINFMGDSGECSIENLGGALKVDNCTFKHDIIKSFAGLPLNSADQMRTAFNIIIAEVANYNAAIYNTGNNTIITNSNFTRNYQVTPVLPSQFASINYALEFYGGAIYNDGTNVSSTNNLFDSNIVQGSSIFQPSNYWWERNELYGGAIYDAGQKTLIKNNTFINNTSPYGGAIKTYANNSTITQNIFIDNYASNAGSAVDDDGQQNKITKNIFINSTDRSDTQLSITENTTATGNIIYYDTDYTNMVPSSQMDHFKKNNTFISQKVLQSSITIKANNTKPRVNDNVKITITLKDGNNKALKNQDITVNINGKTSTLKTNNSGIAITNYTINKNDKSINITANYLGNMTQQASRNNLTVNRTYKADMELLTGSFDTKPGDTVKLIAHIKDNGVDIDGGQLVFKLNGVSLKDAKGNAVVVSIKKGLAVLEYKIPDTLGARTHNLTAVYASNNYGRVELTTPMTIAKYITHIDVNPLYTTTNTIQVKAQIVDQNNQALNKQTAISIKLNGKSYTLNTTTGTINYKITQTLGNGYYNMTIISGENGKYLGSTVKTVLIKSAAPITTNYINNTLNTKSSSKSGDTKSSNIMSILTGASTVKPGDRLKLIAHLSEDGADINGGQLVFKLNGVSLKDAKGNAVVVNITKGLGILDYNIPDSLGARTHNLTAVYSSKKYGRVELTTQLTMNRLNTHIEAEPMFTSSATSYIKAKILDDNNQLINKKTSVVIKVDGKSYSFNTTTGTINYKVNTTLSKGLHQVTIIAGENGKYISSRANTVLIKT
ncbi:MAG: Ig-like domain repeat protein [Methanosphaera sp.]|nr:Ig-like domain repeat protein [Methanosphaera sp.]